MRIAIMGSGGRGGFFGARLCQGGSEVHFIARGQHLQAMCSKGLSVEGPKPFHIPSVKVTDDPKQIGHVDVVMLCVKLWDTEAALEQLRPMVGPDTTIISFQNGVLNETARGEAFLAACLAGGIKAEMSRDIPREIWQKYVFLVGLSGTTSSSGHPTASGGLPLNSNVRRRNRYQHCRRST